MCLPLISTTSSILSSLYAERLQGGEGPLADHRPIGLQRTVRGAHEAEREEGDLSETDPPSPPPLTTPRYLLLMRVEEDVPAHP